MLLKVATLFIFWVEFMIPLRDTHENLELNEEPWDEPTQINSTGNNVTVLPLTLSISVTALF